MISFHTSTNFDAKKSNYKVATLLSVPVQPRFTLSRRKIQIGNLITLKAKRKKRENPYIFSLFFLGMRRVQFGISITAEKIREFGGAKGGKEKICRDPVGGEDRELILPRQVWLGERQQERGESLYQDKGYEFDSFVRKL